AAGRIDLGADVRGESATALEGTLIGTRERRCGRSMRHRGSAAPAKRPGPSIERHGFGCYRPLVYPYALPGPAETSVQVEHPSLENKWALVTGAGKRIGATIAHTLHAAGANVAVHYFKSADDAESVVGELNASRASSAIAVGGDGRDIAASERVVAEDTAHAGRPDSLVNIVDIHAQRPLRHYVVYGAAKAGLAMLTRALAKDLGPEIRVNGVAPGAILWPESGVSESVQQTILKQVPLKRTGSPDDIASA